MRLAVKKQHSGFVTQRAVERIWVGLAELLLRYFRVEVEGLENIPRIGPVVVAANHSGFAGNDVIVLSHIIRKERQRLPHILAHRFYFDFFQFQKLLAKTGEFRLATSRSGVGLLKRDNLLMIFPEGEKGNFKSSFQRYQLQAFDSGFVRMAISAHAPIVPAVVIGAEESNLNWGSIDLGFFAKRYRLPLPINIFPLPAKWKVRFLKPVATFDSDAPSRDSMAAISEEIRSRIQRTINRELKRRPYVFLPQERWLKRGV